MGGGSEDKAYKQLVTDGSGEAKWEDRLAYGDNRVCVLSPKNTEQAWYKVSDSLLTGSYDVGVSLNLTFSDDDVGDTTEISVSNDEVVASSTHRPSVILALRDNATFTSVDGWSILLPEKGTYFFKSVDYFITGAVLGDSNEPEITWDGSVFIGKKIEQKYIPKQTIYLKLEYACDLNDVKQYKTSMTFDEVIECIRDDINVVLVYDDTKLQFYYLTTYSSERATFVYNGTSEDNMWEFTMTSNSSEGPISPIGRYVDSYQGESNADSFLVVGSDGHVIPTEYLILPSSTSGSTKKFKITVDDSGTITATEVTT